MKDIKKERIEIAEGIASLLVLLILLSFDIIWIGYVYQGWIIFRIVLALVLLFAQSVILISIVTGDIHDL